MELRKIATVSSVIALSLAIVSPVAAISVDTGANVNVGVSGSASSTSGDAGADASGSVNGQGSLKAQVQNIISNITGSGKAETNVGADVSAAARSGNATSSGNAPDENSGVILHTRGEIEAAMHASDTAQENASENAAFNRIDLNYAGSPASVRSNADLSAYIATQMKKDNKIQEVQASSGAVTVTYKGPAKFLGFIPASIKATAIADATGNVTISRPWYGFLFSSTDRAELKAAIESQVSAHVDISANARAQAELAADMQAQLVADIHAAMQQHFSASTDVDASADVSADVR